MKNKEEEVLVFLPHYQNNHESYYSFLIDQALTETTINLLAYTFDENLIKQKNNNVKYYYPKRNENLTLFVLRNLKLFKKAKLIIFDEFYNISYILPLIVLIFGHKSLFTIHNINKWLKRGASRQKSFIKSKVIDFMISRVKGLIVISLSLKEYIVNNKLFNKEVFYIPFTNVNNSEQENQLSKNQIVFTIPGTVNTDRRDYHSFLESIYYNIQNKNDKDVKLFLLGKIVKIGKKENELINKINTIKKGTVQFWENYIDNDTFENVLLKTDYLIGNIIVNYSENLITETYGSSKETGVLFLMLKYKIPTLFPVNYKAHPVYENLIIYYNDDINEIVETIINQGVKKIKYDNKTHQSLVEEEIENLKTMIDGVY